jgi:4-hydroxybenzoate polyprenyltransferase
MASLALPALFVAVPYLVGLLSARTAVHGQDLVLLGGLYLGFVGRIVLKDFRDVRGDALFGKRTYLVRHGRRRTCGFSAVGWVLGPACLLGVRGLTPTLVAVEALLVVVALALLRSLADERGARQDEWTISALAIVGRAVVLCVVVHIATVDSRWPAPLVSAIVVVLALAFVGQARAMYRDGPVPRLHVPAAWAQQAKSATAQTGTRR